MPGAKKRKRFFAFSPLLFSEGMTGTPWSVLLPLERSRRILVRIVVPIFVRRAAHQAIGQGNSRVWWRHGELLRSYKGFSPDESIARFIVGRQSA